MLKDDITPDYEPPTVTVLGTLQDTIRTASTIPLVFDPVSLEWQEVTDLKALIRANCSLVDSAEYRSEPTRHMSCPR